MARKGEFGSDASGSTCTQLSLTNITSFFMGVQNQSARLIDVFAKEIYAMLIEIDMLDTLGR